MSRMHPHVIKSKKRRYEDTKISEIEFRRIAKTFAMDLSETNSWLVHGPSIQLGLDPRNRCASKRAFLPS